MNDLNDAAKEARREYKREWNRKNPDKVRAAQKRYWEKRAQQIEAAKAEAEAAAARDPAKRGNLEKRTKQLADAKELAEAAAEGMEPADRRNWERRAQQLTEDARRTTDRSHREQRQKQISAATKAAATGKNPAR